MNTGFLAPGGMGDGFFAPPAASEPPDPGTAGTPMGLSLVFTYAS